MPIYEYQCRACCERFERIQRVNDEPVTECPECSGAVDRLLSSPAIRFKGSGWYLTDYSDKGKKLQAEAKKEASGESDSTSSASKNDKASKPKVASKSSD